MCLGEQQECGQVTCCSTHKRECQLNIAWGDNGNQIRGIQKDLQAHKDTVLFLLQNRIFVHCSYLTFDERDKGTYHKHPTLPPASPPLRMSNA